MKCTLWTSGCYFALVGLCALVLPLVVTAHAVGASYEEEKDGYLIDIGYNPEMPIAGTRTRFDFSIFSLTATSTEDLFTDVWVRITKDTVLYFSSSLNRPHFGPTALNILLVEPGEYDVYVRFQNGATMVTDTTFSILVSTSTKEIELDTTSSLPQYTVFSCFLFLLSWLTWLGYRWWRQRG